MGFPGGTSGKEPACQCRRQKRRGFDPWLWKIPWRRTWQPTLVFLPGKSHGERSWAGYRHLVAISKADVSQHTHTHWRLTSLLFCSSVVPSFFRLHGLQHTRLPCPSLSMRTSLEFQRQGWGNMVWSQFLNQVKARTEEEINKES